MAIGKGDRVLVVKGKKSLGTVGTVFWIGPNKFGEGNRLGIKSDDAETHWVPEAYVEVTALQAPEVEPPEKGASVSWMDGDLPRAGTVFWVGESKAGNGYRVGVKDDDGETHWLDARQLEVTAASIDDEPPPF